MPESAETTIYLEPEAQAPPAAPEFDYSDIPAGYYDEVFHRRRGVQSKWHQLKFDRVIRELSGCPRVLDVGCGPGTMLGMLGERQSAVGIDISPQQIRYANDVYGSSHRSFFACAPNQLPDDLEPFDALSAVELIEHLPPAVADGTLRKAINQLRPGGKVVITTPNFRSAWPLIERLVNRFGEVDYEFQHINRYTPPRLLGLLEHLGLEGVTVRSYLLTAPFAAVLGWRVADVVAKLESDFLDRRLGLLLIATGYKPRLTVGRDGHRQRTTAAG